MASRTTLKSYFELDDKPTAAQFADLIDSILNLTDDDLNQVPGLAAALAAKANSTHSHAIADTTGLQAALDGKAASTHTHAISDTTGLQTALDGKASTSHTQAISTITGLQTALDGKAASVHTHAIADVTNLQESLEDLNTTKADISDLVPLFLSSTDDAAVITALASATWTNNVATVSGWDAGRFHQDASYVYVSIADNTVHRIFKTSVITVSTSAASGGADGDIWIQVPA